MVDAALSSIHIDDYFLRVIITSCNLNQACYLLLDNLLWLNTVGVIELKRKLKPMNEWSNKFWLFSTILYLARDFHDLIGILQNEAEKEINSKQNDPVNRYTWNETSGAYTTNLASRSNIPGQIMRRILKKIRILLCNKNYHPLLIDTLKNVFDLFLPLSSLDFVKISPGMQGLCGLVSSLLSLLVIWEPKYKLKP